MLDALKRGFSAHFGGVPEGYFAAPGRTEIGGNHTDHQRGRVLAAAVSLDTRAAAARNGTSVIRVVSEGWPMCQVDLREPDPKEQEKGTSAALVRGVAAWFARRGYPVEGFDAYVTSTVLPGSGLSSSAAFEVLIGTIMDGLFLRGALAPEQIAVAAQYGENVYFGKPCGLMDQMASAVGGLVTIDFYEPAAPRVRSVAFDFSSCGHALCIIDTGAEHGGLTGEYAAIPVEMGAVARYFGEEVLSRVEEDAFYGALPGVRAACGDRAVLRAAHFFREQQRVDRQVAALERGDFPAFLALVEESGRSSWELLQNITVSGSDLHQEMAVALVLARRLLQGQGACRVHGGGFAGTIQAFVPEGLLERFRSGIEAALGPGSCHVLSIVPRGCGRIG